MFAQLLRPDQEMLYLVKQAFSMKKRVVLVAETCYDASFVKLLLKGVAKYSDLVVLQKNTTQTQILKRLKLKPKQTLIIGQPLNNASPFDLGGFEYI